MNRRRTCSLLAGLSALLLLLSACSRPESSSSLSASLSSDAPASSAPALTTATTAAPESPTTTAAATTAAPTTRTTASAVKPTTAAKPTETVPPPVSTTAAHSIKGMAMGRSAESLFVDFQATAAARNGTVYTVDFTMTNVAAAPHDYSITQRIKLLDAARTGVTAARLTDRDTGADLNGKSLESGQTVHARASFTLPDGYQPVAFAYTYDIMGFGIFTYLLP